MPCRSLLSTAASLLSKVSLWTHRAGAGWKIAKREFTLDQNVLLAKNLAIFV